MSMTSSKTSGEPFFLVMALALLGVVLIGFSSSFYLRDAALESLSTSLVVHGVALTLWFVLGLVQSLLIGVGRSAGRMRIHRRIGMASVFIVGGVLWTGTVVAVDFYRGGSGDIVVSAAALLFANLVNLIGFAICFIRGVAQRKSAQLHKRYMTWASVVIIAPASFRLVQGIGLPPAAAAVAQLLFVGVLFGYDYLQLKRILAPSWFGFAIVAFQMVGSFTIGNSEVWEGLVEWVF